MIEFSDLLAAASKSDSINEEVLFRTSVHQSYYGLYHRALIFAEANGYKFDDKKRGGVHVQLANFFLSSTDKNLKSIGKNLRDCSKIRVRADYYLSLNINEGDALKHLRICNLSVNDIGRVSSK